MEWVVLIAVIVALLTIDLLLHRGNHEPTAKRALVESAAWVACGLGFAVVVLVWKGGDAFSEYLSGYVIEKSLSIDNVFVWAVIFSQLRDPARVPAPGAVLGHLRRAGAARRSSSSPARR